MRKYTKVVLLQELADYYKKYNKIPVGKKFHIAANTYSRHFGSWNNALKLAGIPLRTDKKERICKNCDKTFVRLNHIKSEFCSVSCSTTYHNKKSPKRKKSNKKKETPYQIWKNNIVGEYCKVRFLKCGHCGALFASNKKVRYCKEHKELYSTENRQRYRFSFNLYNYPDLFDIKMIERIGWYCATKNSQHKLTRDHKVSVFEAIKNEYEPFYISHPLNCELMSWNDNYKKREKSSIEYKKLVQIVNLYEFEKLGRESNP